MGMRKERCPKCKKMRPRAPKGDSNPNYWVYDPEVGRGVCWQCQLKAMGDLPSGALASGEVKKP